MTDSKITASVPERPGRTEDDAFGQPYTLWEKFLTHTDASILVGNASGPVPNVTEA